MSPGFVQMVADADRCLGRSATDDYFDAARATGRRRAEQRMPLDDVLRSFRLGGRLVWEALIDEARAQGVVDSDALLDVASKVWEVVDSTSSQVAAAYHAAERQARPCRRATQIDALARLATWPRKTGRSSRRRQRFSTSR